MKYKSFLIAFLFVQSSFAQNTKTTPSANIQAIEAILQNQTAAWNKGDLDAFMVGYWESDSLVFIGKSGPTYGYKNTLTNYKKNYPDTNYMGKLHFDIVSIKPLGGEHYFVIGKWFLQRNVGNRDGIFTLVFRKTKEGWKIISDHSS
ncbi:MAG: YybH family protein [Sediminibacterium sp.]|jgi:ketosteroid isomerase-like protein